MEEPTQFTIDHRIKGRYCGESMSNMRNIIRNVLERAQTEPVAVYVDEDMISLNPEESNLDLESNPFYQALLEASQEPNVTVKLTSPFPPYSPNKDRINQLDESLKHRIRRNIGE